MADSKKKKATKSAARPPRDQSEEKRPETDEDDTEGHVSVADLWLPSNNKWKRRN